MTDRECVEFLQWALPQLGLRWPGFRKVRRQVHKRLNRRLRELGLTEISQYREYLGQNSNEWSMLAEFARISISRFYRDRDVFNHLRDVLLPDVADRAQACGDEQVRVWSAGCASGEEPYTVAIIWANCIQPLFPNLSLRLVASDADPQMLKRARRASYPASSLKDLPADWRDTFFKQSGAEYVLAQTICTDVEFQQQDICESTPEGSFNIVLCRNLVFTYFDDRRQRQVLERLRPRLKGDGCLIIGKHETLPADSPGLLPACSMLRIFRRH